MRLKLHLYCNNFGCNSVQKHTVILCILSFICYIGFHPYLKECSPQTAIPIRGVRYSRIQTRELNKNFDVYFSLTAKAKQSLATSLGITKRGLSTWMSRKLKKETDLQTLHQQEGGINAAGI